MPRVRRSETAVADLKGIWQYIAADNRTAADRFLRRIAVRLGTVAHHPLMGQARPQLGPGVRSMPFGNYVIFYAPTSTGIHVLRILHGARDIEALLREHTTDL